jgi:hypothetical protein
VIKVDKKWSLEKAFKEINGAHNPGGMGSGPLRNAALQQWIALIGGKKASLLIEKEIEKLKSKANFCRTYQISTSTLNRLIAFINNLEDGKKNKNRFEHVDKAYDFLITKEKSGLHFTIRDLVEYTGWKESTCKTYPTKRWHQYIDRDGEQYTSTGISYLSKEEFRAVHSQKLQKTADHSAKGILLNKAREFALLAVSTYNNPYTSFKTYGYIVNIIIAYTALFHAIFEKNGVEYLYRDKKGKHILIDEEEKAWDLQECAKQYWGGEGSAEKTNIDFLIGLRNKIEHRSLPAIDLAVSGECQSSLNNFENLLIAEFGDEYALIANLATTMQLTRVSQQAQADALKQLQRDNYKVVREYMETFRQDLDEEILESQKYRIRAFLIPKLGNHAKSSDLSIEFVNISQLSREELDSYEQGVAFIKGVESPYRLRPGKVVDIIKAKIPSFNMTMHTKSWRYYEARPAKHDDKNWKGEFSGYSEGYDGYLYSKKWVSHLLEVLKDEDEVKKIRSFS